MANSVHIDQTALTRVGTDGLRKLVDRTTRRVLNRSQVLCPVDTGNLRASGRRTPTVVFGGLVRGEVIYDAEYAAAVHEGRRALTIRPRSNSPRARLRFVVDGRVVWARSVHQPARAGRPFLRTALIEEAGAAGFRIVSVG